MFQNEIIGLVDVNAYKIGVQNGTKFKKLINSDKVQSLKCLEYLGF